ncbi:Molybdopterin guanine dinucleotide synthesis protein B, putative [Trypanosoma equiperdum]|uniref:Molybdopterin guanine dinucleotide synthesis protein B, putative n=1 Tax=Trypanosoma equiperdum TaxID=5694 RepID=A0A1G4IIH9_TRYEQ|nr:Molybdopterin guanine dinucleotide synthesis protein B, putative [Trypanosoma equiperdum]
MRRRRQPLTAGITEVDVGEGEEKKARDGTDFPAVNICSWSVSADAIAADLGNQHEGKGDRRDVGDEADVGPPLKRFKIPDKALARIEAQAALARDNVAEQQNPAVGDDATDVIRRRKFSALKYCTEVADERDFSGVKKPLISVGRLPRHTAEQRQQLRRAQRNVKNMTSTSGPLGLFADGGDVIRFGSVGSGSSDSNPSETSSFDDEGCRTLTGNAVGRSASAAREIRNIDRHFSGYDSEDLPPVSGLLDEETEESEEYEESEESEEERKIADSGVNFGDCCAEANGGTVKVMSVKRGFGFQQQRRLQEGARSPGNQHVADEGTEIGVGNETAAGAAVSTGRCQRYGGVLFEMHINRAAAAPCHHTLLHVRNSITVQGPCCIIGFGIGEITVGGFFLGRKHITLLSDSQKVVVMPVRPLKSKSAASESLPVPKRQLHLPAADDCVVVAPPASASFCRFMGIGEPTAAGDTASERDCEADDLEMFGTVDWDWVEASVARVQEGRHAADNSCVVLVVQPYKSHEKAPTRRRYLVPRDTSSSKRENGGGRHRGKLHSDSFVEVPLFLARQPVPGVDAALLPDVVPAVVRHGSGAVVVLGSKGIGKSTLCRFLANALLSQHGVCYWLELDIGQPEFGPPGVLSLYCVSKPLLAPHESDGVDFVRGYYVGGTRLRCPVAGATALTRICGVAEQLRKRYPIIVNTHGWVLSTGRRMTVEAVRRLQPTHIIHLAKRQEEQWARFATELVDPIKGLNASVVNKRFLVHKQDGIACGAAGADSLPSSRILGLLPHAHDFRPKRSSTSAEATKSSSLPKWSGTVHTVQVVRDEGLLRKSMQPKASAIRRGMWGRYLAPIFEYYEATRLRHVKQQVSELYKGEEPIIVGGRRTTTLFTGELSHFESLVFTDVADASDLTVDFVCAALAHSVVAFSIRVISSSPAQGVAVSHKTESLTNCDAQAFHYPNCRSLVDLPDGFPITCFGIVESNEADMRSSGKIRIRLPVGRDDVHKMLSVSGEGKRVCISLACTLADRSETAAVEALF